MDARSTESLRCRSQRSNGIGCKQNVEKRGPFPQGQSHCCSIAQKQLAQLSRNHLMEALSISGLYVTFNSNVKGVGTCMGLRGSIRRRRQPVIFGQRGPVRERQSEVRHRHPGARTCSATPMSGSRAKQSLSTHEAVQRRLSTSAATTCLKYRDKPKPQAQ